MAEQNDKEPVTVAQMIEVLSRVEDKNREVAFDTEAAKFAAHLVRVMSVSHIEQTGEDDYPVILRADSADYVHGVDKTDEIVPDTVTHTEHQTDDNYEENADEGVDYEHVEEDELPLGFICVKTQQGYAMIKADSITCVEGKGEDVSACIHLTSGTYVFTTASQETVMQRWFNELSAMKVHGEKMLACDVVKPEKNSNMKYIYVLLGILLFIAFILSWYMHGLQSHVVTDLLLASIFIELSRR